MQHLEGSGRPSYIYRMHGF